MRPMNSSVISSVSANLSPSPGGRLRTNFFTDLFCSAPSRTVLRGVPDADGVYSPLPREAREDVALLYRAVCKRGAGLRAKQRRKGVSLFDVALYLGIAGVLVSGALVSLRSSSNAQKVTDTLNMVGQIQRTVRGIAAGGVDYDGVTTAMVIQSNQMPRKLVRGTGASATLTNPFNGGTTIALNASNARFGIVMTGFPRDACTKLAVADLGPAVASVTISASGAATLPSDLPTNPVISATDANTNCSGNVNSIAWEFF